MAQHNRHINHWRITYTAVLLILGVSAAPYPAKADNATLEQIILEAGNSDDDALRLQILKRLQAIPDLNVPLDVEVNRVVALVERWNNDWQLFQWFHREIRSTVDYDFSVRTDSPLYPITCIYRGRMLVWTANEFGNILGYHDERRRFFDQAVEKFQIAAKSFPENRIVRMYLGEPFPPAKLYSSVPSAPAWAVYQREGLERS